MVMSKKTTAPVCHVTVKWERLEQVSCFNYLGSMVTSDGKSDTEIKRRIGIAKTVYKKMERLLTSRNVDLETRIRLLKCYVWSTFYSSRPPKIPIGLYHSPWFIVIFSLHCIALHFISCLVLYCFVVQCTIVCLAFWFLVFWLQVQ